MVNMENKTFYRDLYNSFKDDPDKALEQLKHKAFVEGYGEHHRLNKRWFEFMWKQNEKL